MQTGFKTLIVNLRKERDYTQAQLAKALGVSTSTVAMWERGERYPTRTMCEKIADFFDVDMDYLYGRTKTRKRGNSTDDSGIQITVSPKEKRFLDYFSRLNDLGQDKILGLLADFTQLPTYTNKEESSSLLENIG